MRKTRVGFLAIAVLALPVLSQASIIYYFDTGQTTAQPSIDTADYTAWWGTPAPGAPVLSGVSFSGIGSSFLDATFDWQLGGGNFDMKEGTGTSGTLTLSIWLGSPTTNLAQALQYVTITAAQFCTEKTTLGNGCQQLSAGNPVPLYFTDDHTFYDPSVVANASHFVPFQIVSGNNYTVELSSTASTSGNGQFFIKGPNLLSIQNPGGGSLTPPALTPEPGTLAQLGSGFALCLMQLRKRRNSAV
jgi:hypothetical protein